MGNLSFVGDRPCRACALPSPCDELAAPYSITRLACARTASGIVTPIAFAVLRLTTSSNLVGYWTGSHSALHRAGCGQYRMEHAEPGPVRRAMSDQNALGFGPGYRSIHQW
jgi:hypothetical protein